jgi:hypothetical protein
LARLSGHPSSSGIGSLTDMLKDIAGRHKRGAVIGNRSSWNSKPVELLFHEPWWLAAVTRDQIQEVKVEKSGRVIGRLPFVVFRKAGLTTLRMPPFTHLLGPAVIAGEGKAQTRLLQRLSIVRELLDQLPRFDYFKHAFPATTADGLAFQDRGFKISPQYTFRIDCRRDLPEIWQGMHFKTRQHIRRAEEKLTIETVEDPTAFINFYISNLSRRRRRTYWDFTNFPTLFTETTTRGCGKILSANWPNGEPAAMIFIVWGRGTMYYLLSTRAGSTGDNGSVNLLIWSAIKRAHSEASVLDLDGVVSSGTARFLSGFGGHLEMRLVAERSGHLYSALRGIKRQIVGGMADETEDFA